MNPRKENVNVYLKSGVWNVSVGDSSESEYQTTNRAKALRVAAIVSARENLGVAIFDSEVAFNKSKKQAS